MAQQSNIGIDFDGELLSFKDARGVATFLQGERDTFRGVDSWFNAWEQVFRHLREVQQAPDSQQAIYANNALREWYNCCKNGQLAYSKSAKGKFILSLGTSADGAARYYSGQTFNNNALNKYGISGAVQAVLFDLGISGSDSSKALLNDVITAWNAFQTSAREERERIASAQQQISEAVKQGSETQMTAQVSQFNKMMADSSSQLTAAHERLSTLEKTYSDKLALEAPVEYWTKQHQRHKNIAVWFGIGFALSLLTGSIALWLLLARFLDQAQPPLWRIGVCVTTGMLVVWGIRVLAKLLFANLHLSVDAKERATLIMTYLAMSKQSEALRPEERSLILSPIFARSAAASGNADDLSPNIIQDVISKIKG